MHLWLADRLVRDSVEAKYYFRMAHQWRFGRDVDTTRDALEYKLCGIIPLYVQEFIHHTQQKEATHGERK